MLNNFMYYTHPNFFPVNLQISRCVHVLKSGNFRDNFIFENSVKKHICDVKNSRPGHDIPLSVNDRVISPFRKGYIFTKLRICEVSQK